MDLVFEATKGFEDDLAQLAKSERKRVIAKINQKCQLLLSDRKAFGRGLTQPCRLELANGFKSSLYAFKASVDLRVIFTVDDDPIFNRILVTLLRVVKEAYLTQAYRETAIALYQPEGFLSGQAEEYSEPHQVALRRIRRDSRGGKKSALK